MKYLQTITILLCSYSVFAQKEFTPTSEVTISGLVERPFTFHVSDVSKYKEDDLGDVIIRNHKGEEKGKAKDVKGILLKTLLDSAHIHVNKPKEYSALYIVLTASDGYKNVYSWNELCSSEVGNHIYIITGSDGKTFDQLPDRIETRSLGDYNSGSRHLKALSKIEVKKVE